jgi:hypothetical protein
MDSVLFFLEDALTSLLGSYFFPLPQTFTCPLSTVYKLNVAVYTQRMGGKKLNENFVTIIYGKSPDNKIGS